jgi:hypothetical protein
MVVLSYARQRQQVMVSFSASVAEFVDVSPLEERSAAGLRQTPQEHTGRDSTQAEIWINTGRKVSIMEPWLESRTRRKAVPAIKGPVHTAHMQLSHAHWTYLLFNARLLNHWLQRSE